MRQKNKSNIFNSEFTIAITKEHFFKRLFRTIRIHTLSAKKGLNVRNERCAYCGWWLHPHARGLASTQRPMKMVQCQTKDGHMICSNCAHNPMSNY